MITPNADIDSAPFWAALRDHRIVLQQCGGCGRNRFPPMPGCPYCGAVMTDTVEVDGAGRLYSWVRVHRPLTPDVHAVVPYNVGVVELDAGPRMIVRFDGDTTIGARATPDFADHDGWTELRYRVDA